MKGNQTTSTGNRVIVLQPSSDTALPFSMKYAEFSCDESFSSPDSFGRGLEQI